MTEAEINDCFTAIGRAFTERRELNKRIKELDQRIRSVNKAISTLVDNQFHEDSNKIIDSANDPLEDWAELKRSLARLSELDKILSS